MSFSVCQVFVNIDIFMKRGFMLKNYKSFVVMLCQNKFYCEIYH